jgi:peroxiredoxin
MKRSFSKYVLLATLAIGGVSAWGDSIQNGGGSLVTIPREPAAIKIHPSALSAASAKKPFPINTLKLKGLDGKTHSLKEWQGQVVLLNFWATWCAPCLYEIRDFVSYQDKYEKQGLQIIGVGLDEEKKLRNVQRSLDINYPILIADLKKDRSLMVSWGNTSGIVPYTVLLDRNGNAVYSQHGQLNSEEFDENVLPLLGK